MVEEKKKQNLEAQEFDLESLSTKRSISKQFKNTQKKIIKKSNIFLTYQVPSAKDNFTSWIKSYRGGVILITLIFMSVIPLLLDEPLYYRTFMLAMIYTIYAASWDMLAGITGQVSFGHAAFFGIGGYACGAFVLFNSYNWFIALLIGGIYAVVFGLVIAIPSLRFKGPYLALGTLAFSLLLAQLFSMSSLKDIFYGENGIPIILTFLLIDVKERYIFVLLIMIASVVIMLAISNSKLGTIFKAIRDDEISTEASGINVVKYKIIAFMISAFFAGIAGGIYVLDQTKADPGLFAPIYSFYPVIMASLGGIALISGAAFGAYFFSIMIIILDEIIDLLTIAGILPPGFSDLFSYFGVFVFSIMLLLIVRFTERGLMEPFIKQSKSLWDLLLGK